MATNARSVMSQAEQPDASGPDGASFEEFVAGSSSHLFSLARLLTGGHRAEAEELLQVSVARQQPIRVTLSASGGTC
jgi:hypothetical protein